MKKLYLILGIFIFSSYVLLHIHFIFSPILHKGFINIFSHKINSISDARIYFTVISAISTMASGFIGISLGYIYFSNRINFDKYVKEKDKLESLVNNLIFLLNKYDDCILDIVSSGFENASELERSRDKSQRYFDDIQLIIENNENTLSIKQQQIFDIIKLNSFVEKSNEIMRTRFHEIKKLDLRSTKETYNDLFRQAKSSCYLNFNN